MNFKNLSDTLEEHFGDMCGFDFTVQDGKLYLLNARIGKRSPQATIRIATDLLVETKITGKDLLSRVSPSIVEAVLRPKIGFNADRHR